MANLPRRGRKKVKDSLVVTRTLDRGLMILEAVAEAGELSLSDIARRIEITPTTASRLIDTLMLRGFLSVAQGGRYQIGIRALAVGSAVARSYRLDQVSVPAMIALSEEIGETVSLGIRDGDALVYIEQVEGVSAVRARVRLGRRMPLHATAGGKVLLSHFWESALNSILGPGPFQRFTANTKTSVQQITSEIADVRSKGWALDNEEFEDNICTIAGPIRDRHDQVIAALSVTRLAARTPCKGLERMAPALIAAAENISLKLGWQPNRSKARVEYSFTD